MATPAEFVTTALIPQPAPDKQDQELNVVTPVLLVEGQCVVCGGFGCGCPQPIDGSKLPPPLDNPLAGMGSFGAGLAPAIPSIPLSTTAVTIIEDSTAENKTEGIKETEGTRCTNCGQIGCGCLEKIKPPEVSDANPFAGMRSLQDSLSGMESISLPGETNITSEATKGVEAEKAKPTEELQADLQAKDKTNIDQAVQARDPQSSATAGGVIQAETAVAKPATAVPVEIKGTIQQEKTAGDNVTIDSGKVSNPTLVQDASVVSPIKRGNANFETVIPDTKTLVGTTVDATISNDFVSKKTDGAEAALQRGSGTELTLGQDRAGGVQVSSHENPVTVTKIAHSELTNEGTKIAETVVGKTAISESPLERSTDAGQNRSTNIDQTLQRDQRAAPETVAADNRTEIERAAKNYQGISADNPAEKSDLSTRLSLKAQGVIEKGVRAEKFITPTTGTLFTRDQEPKKPVKTVVLNVINRDQKSLRHKIDNTALQLQQQRRIESMFRSSPVAQRINQDVAAQSMRRQQPVSATIALGKSSELNRRNNYNPQLIRERLNLQQQASLQARLLERVANAHLAVVRTAARTSNPHNPALKSALQQELLATRLASMLRANEHQISQQSKINPGDLTRRTQDAHRLATDAIIRERIADEARPARELTGAPRKDAVLRDIRSTMNSIDSSQRNLRNKVPGNVNEQLRSRVPDLVATDRVVIQKNQVDRVMTLIREQAMMVQPLPDMLQRIIAVYLMEQLAQFRSAQDLLSMVEEVNAEWAERMRELNIEMLLRAGVEIVSDVRGTSKKKRTRVSSSVMHLDDQKRRANVKTKSSGTDGMTSGSKMGAQIQKGAAKVSADITSPVAELIVSRVKAEDQSKRKKTELVFA